ncbi:glucans biosynthesis glucosyltransferase MdoH [Vulcaniibacterium tengchongense]|uniref:Glucans biosynthesis glucosyltransferase H n=1 Tax=Vulcaniibacterium tengchongense TaxID=1273429 RepID=A0A3N4VI57_9GAMM|nr:glucans biosynthesis glucosyltransferase MdoH [Vulcaniibacterium tengchongense]RPE81185.1 membrane glycosyltransferase [Vulcaniibacterium tengchongense]
MSVMTDSLALELARAAPLLPPEAPLEMPIQSLSAGRLQRPRLPTTPRGMAWRRAVVIGGAGLLTLVATYQIWWVLRGAGTDVLETILLLLFVALFAWIAQAFVSAVAGFFVIATRRPGRLGLDNDAPLPVVRSRTALLMPTYNEDPERLMAGLQAIYESLRATGQLDRFDFFVLSDTTRPEVRAQEIDAFARLRERTGDRERLFYRLRRDNRERKAGNIAEWVRRFGAAYPHMLILDADSLMTGETIVRLAGAMERNGDVALIQTLPLIVNGTTLFARMQQFASRVYGPVIAHGIAWWHGAESNYWGHNAIIRTRAFAQCAGLPELRGFKPFGGTVLSHDFVEAALLRRGGWALHMAPNLAGSYEEGPPSLTDMLVRDRRWCQGNLQHGAVLPSRGLHWVSRWHLAMGIGHYFTSPMWAMLMLVGLAIPLQKAGLAWQSLSVPEFSPTRYWRDQDPERFLWVFLMTMVVLLAPKVLGYLTLFFDRAARRGCGGALRALASMVLETLLAALMAPITMYVQSRGLAEVLAGKDSGWDAQRRDDGTLPLSALVRRYGGMGVLGAAAGAAAYLISPSLAAWMAPVIAGLVLAIPIVAITSARPPGQWLQRIGVFLIPEERDPPPILARATELRRAAKGQ